MIRQRDICPHTNIWPNGYCSDCHDGPFETAAKGDEPMTKPTSIHIGGENYIPQSEYDRLSTEHATLMEAVIELLDAEDNYGCGFDTDGRWLNANDKLRDLVSGRQQ